MFPKPLTRSRRSRSQGLQSGSDLRCTLYRRRRRVFLRQKKAHRKEIFCFQRTCDTVFFLCNNAKMSTYGRNLIKISIWQNLDNGQVFTPQPRFAARIPLFVWETQTYPQIAVPGTVRHGSEVEVIQLFTSRISENTKIGPW